jgi:hypothetical protein
MEKIMTKSQTAAMKQFDKYKNYGLTNLEEGF